MWVDITDLNHGAASGRRKLDNVGSIADVGDL